MPLRITHWDWETGILNYIIGRGQHFYGDGCSGKRLNHPPNVTIWARQSVALINYYQVLTCSCHSDIAHGMILNTVHKTPLICTLK